MKPVRIWLFSVIFIAGLCMLASSSSWIRIEPKFVALTFDDGPRPESTDQLLDTLKRHHVKGTFFVVGQMAELYPEGVLRMVQDGHEVANHSWSHPLMKDTTEREFILELEKTDDLIMKLTGRSNLLFRPPGSTRRQLEKLSPPSGRKMVLWDVHSQDHLGLSAKQIIRNVLDATQDGDVLLFHNGLPNTIQALDVIIPVLKRRGFQFVVVSDLLKRRDVDSVISEFSVVRQ